MKGFHFRLDPVLELRRHREESLQRQLADSQRAFEVELARLEALRHELDLLAQRMAQHGRPGPLDLEGLRRESAYLVALERQRDGQAVRVEARARRVAEDREAVLLASRDRKVLEKLRETLMQAFLREAGRKEQKGLEEMATVRHLRRSRVEAGI